MDEDEKNKKIEEQKLQKLTVASYIALVVNIFLLLMLFMPSSSGGTSDAEALEFVISFALLLIIVMGVAPLVNGIFVVISMIGIVKSSKCENKIYFFLNILSFILWLIYFGVYIYFNLINDFK